MGTWRWNRSARKDTAPFPPQRDRTGERSFQLGTRQRRAGRNMQREGTARAGDASRDGDQGTAAPCGAPPRQGWMLLSGVAMEQVIGQQLEQQHSVVGSEAIAGGMADSPRPL